MAAGGRSGAGRLGAGRLGAGRSGAGRLGAGLRSSSSARMSWRPRRGIMGVSAMILRVAGQRACTPSIHVTWLTRPLWVFRHENAHG